MDLVQRLQTPAHPFVLDRISLWSSSAVPDDSKFKPNFGVTSGGSWIVNMRPALTQAVALDFSLIIELAPFGSFDARMD